MGIENPIHLLFIGVVALLVLGPKRLPGLARGLGRGVREFREAIGQGAQTPPTSGAPVEPVTESTSGAPTVEPVTEPLTSGASTVEPVTEPTSGASTVEPGTEPLTSGASTVEPATQPPPEEPPGSPPEVGPRLPVRSGDAPDRRPL
jgi:TatA/E family protein of Tat protein translocase